MSYVRLVSVRDQDQYLIGSVVPIGCCCNDTQPIWTSQASVSSVMGPVLLGIVRMGGHNNAIFSKFMDFDSALLRGLKLVGWSFCSSAFSSAARWAKFGSNYRNTFHNPKKDERSVLFVDSFNLLIAFVLCDVILRRLRRITCSRWSFVLEQWRHFFNLRGTPSLQKNVSTI